MKQRISVSAKVGGFSFLLVVVLWALMAHGELAVAAESSPKADPQQALRAGATWLVDTHQNDNGGYTSFSTGANQADSDMGGTADALLALSAAEADIAPLLAYLTGQNDAVAAYAGQNGATAGKLVLALTLSGADPRNFAGYNLVLSVTSHLSPSGQFGVNTPFEQALAMMSLAMAGEPVPEEATNWLLERQATDGDLAGSWDDGFGTAGNPDATGFAILALLGSGQGVSDPIAAAVDFLTRAQLLSGGWEYGPGFGESANSTALAMQALLATGQDLFSANSPWQTENGSNPVGALLGWQGESGAFQADFGQGRFDDYFATVQSLPALALAVNLAPDPEPTVAPTETAVPSPTTEPVEPTDEPSPTVAPADTPEPEPTATAVPEATATPVVMSSPEVPPADSGNSLLPYFIVGAALVSILGVVFWYRRNNKGFEGN